MPISSRVFQTEWNRGVPIAIIVEIVTAIVFGVFYRPQK